VELPLPFSLGLINVYLVRLHTGWLLVDCGMDTASCFAALERAVEGLGAGWTGIRQVLLTHVHPDHMGLAERVLQLTGAQLHFHHADEQWLLDLCRPDGYPHRQRTVLTEAGVPPDRIEAIEASMEDVQRQFRPLVPDVRLHGGENLPLAIGHLEVMWTPGHSPGHVCLYSPEQRMLLSGDQILERISPNIGWRPDRDALADYLASLEAIAALDIDLILPAHGSPFRGHREWVASTRRHHEVRCLQILAALDGAERTAAGLVEALWTRELSPFHYRFAVFEVLAHLEYLRHRGRVGRRMSGAAAVWTR